MCTARCAPRNVRPGRFERPPLFFIHEAVSTKPSTRLSIHTVLIHPHLQEYRTDMAIDVKIPTILRTYTGGAKSVTAEGATLSALIDDLDTNHNGLKARLIMDDGGLHRFVNVYVNDEDVRFTGSLETPLKDGDAVTILPAVAGGSF
jgi:molybdopterin synthase sulfur carrier subunit